MADSLKIIVAELLAISPDQIASDRVLSGARLQGSLGRSILDAALRRRLGVQTQACYTAKTFGELEAAVNGAANGVAVPTITNGSPAASPEAPAFPPPPVAAAAVPAIPVMAKTPPMFAAAAPPVRPNYTNQSASCGVDIEEVANLPATADYWSHEYYTTHFTAGEIAYCLTQQSPALHFAARWSAKEALKKCEPALIREQMRNIEVVSGADGAPSLRLHANGSPVRLPHALSLSHTNHSAVAVVVRVPVQPAPPPPPTPLPSAPSYVTEPAPQSRGLGILTFACSLLALALGIIALVLVTHRH